MPSISAARIRLAARFSTDNLSVSVLIRSWGGEDKVLIRVGSTSCHGRDPLGTWVYGRWREQSHLLTYWGPKKEDGDCLDALFLCKNDKAKTKQNMQEVVEVYLLSQLDKSTGDRLRGDFKQHLNILRLADFVDGESEDSWSGALGLASAQNLSAKIASQSPLSTKDCERLQVLLTEAPLQFGYWGPIKTALKHLDPALMPKKYGIALARLSQPSETACRYEEVEDLDWMQMFTDIPSENTLLYMARRMRRQLAQIGRNNPTLYTSIAASLLQHWDGALGSYSYLPAYVLGGDQKVLDETGRVVHLPLDQSSRRDAHPEAWDNHRTMLRELLPQIFESVETFTFASQVLMAAGESLLNPKTRQLLLALRSSDSRLVSWACAVILRRPSQWKSLSTEQWRIFFDKAEQSQISELCEKQGKSPLPKTVSAAADVLACLNDNQNLQDAVDDRCQLIAGFYITAIATDERCLRVATPRATSFALLHASYSPRRGTERELLIAHMREFDSDELMDLYLKLLDRSDAVPASLDVLEDSFLTSQIRDDERRQLVLQILKLPQSRAVAMGWKLLDLCSNIEELVASVWQWIRHKETPHGFSSQGWQDRRGEFIFELLARNTDPVPRLLDLIRNDTWQLDAAGFAQLILPYPASLRGLWNALASGEENSTERLITILDDQPKMLLALGNALEAADLSAVSVSQQQLLLRYVRDSSRVSADQAFAVAAVALGDLELQRECLDQLLHSKGLGQCWLRLAELGLPYPLEIIKDYLSELKTTSELTDAVLACVDSIVPAVRDLGLGLIASNSDRIDHDRLWPALSESDDPVVQARVAQESMSRSWPNADGLAAFDRRLLVSRRVNRSAKKQVQDRLTTEQLLAPARRAALLDLAHGANGQDREWALRRIAELALSGVPFDGVAVRAVTTPEPTGVMN
jgi:hypothetical protein